MLNNNEKNGHPSLVPDRRESVSVFQCWESCLLWFVIYGLYYIEVGSFYACFLESFHHKLASLVAQTAKNLPAMKETWVQSLGWEDPLEKEMASSFSILAWRIPWIGEPSKLQSMQSQRVEHNIIKQSTLKSDWLYSLQPKMEKLYTISKNKTRSWLWLRSWTPYCQIQT